MFFLPNSYDDQILGAANNGDLKLLQRLRNETDDDVAFRLKCEFVAELEGLTCLHFAAEKGNIPICRFLIEKVKLDINIKTDKGDSPLLLAAANGHFSTAKYFIIRGADVKMSGYKGTTCWHIAAEKGNKEIMQLLVLKGADIEAHSVRGTPLQCAASCGNVESVRFLIRRGANPNSVSPISVSPLMGAIFCGSYECLELLLKAGADPNIRSRGLSPLAVAAREDDTGFLRSLLAAGANPNSITIKKQRRDAYFQLFDELGKNAAKLKDYPEAVKWFSEAIYLQPDNERLLSNRSICWVHLHEPNFSLHDAEACVMLKPDWPKAHYRAGVAWMLLKNYTKACASFKMASSLDPGNMEIKKALSLALKPVILRNAEQNLPKTVALLAWLVPFCDAFYSNLLYLAEEHPSEAMHVLREFLDSSSLFRLL